MLEARTASSIGFSVSHRQSQLPKANLKSLVSSKVKTDFLGGVVKPLCDALCFPQSLAKPPFAQNMALHKRRSFD